MYSSHISETGLDFIRISRLAQDVSSSTNSPIIVALHSLRGKERARLGISFNISFTLLHQGSTVVSRKAKKVLGECDHYCESFTSNIGTAAVGEKSRLGTK